MIPGVLQCEQGSSQIRFQFWQKKSTDRGIDPSTMRRTRRVHEDLVSYLKS